LYYVQYAGSAEEASKFKYEVTANSSVRTEDFIRNAEPIALDADAIALKGSYVLTSGKVFNDNSNDITVTITRVEETHS